MAKVPGSTVAKFKVGDRVRISIPPEMGRGYRGAYRDGYEGEVIKHIGLEHEHNYYVRPDDRVEHVLLFESELQPLDIHIEVN